MKAFTTTYRGPTSTRGSRIVASGCDKRRESAFDYSATSIAEVHRQAAVRFAVGELGAGLAQIAAGPEQMAGAELKPGQWVWILKR